jgi:MYXO-CTERM domain-containing protein
MYELFATTLTAGIAEYAEALARYDRGDIAANGALVQDPTHEAPQRFTTVTSYATRLEAIMTPHAVEAAFGRPEGSTPGIPADPANITGLASSILSVYRDVLDWCVETRTLQLPTAWRPVYAAMADLARPALTQIASFATEFSSATAEIHDAIEAGRSPKSSLSLALTLSIPDSAMQRYNDALASVHIDGAPQTKSHRPSNTALALGGIGALAWLRRRK